MEAGERALRSRDKVTLIVADISRTREAGEVEARSEVTVAAVSTRTGVDDTASSLDIAEGATAWEVETSEVTLL